MNSRLASLKNPFQAVFSIWMLPVFVFAMIASFSVNAGAQDYIYQTGSPAFSVAQPISRGPYFQGFLNIANGNVHLQIPLGSAPQRGALSFRSEERRVGKE